MKNEKGKTATTEKKKSTTTTKSIAKIAEPIVKEAEKTLKETPVVSMVSVQDRFDRLEQFQALERKHVAIKAKSQQLKVLRKANDGTRATIRVEANSEAVVLSDSNLIDEVLNLLDTRLEALNVETEKEVLEFVI